MEILRGAEHAPLHLYLQDRRGQQRLQRHLRGPAGPVRNKIAPLVVPIWDEGKKVTGIIDVLNKRAYEMQDLKRVEIDIPEGKDAVIEEFNNALKESVAETSEEFMDKFFGGEDFTYAEMIHGLRQACGN